MPVKKMIIEAALIIAASLVLGFTANALNPHKVELSSVRPSATVDSAALHDSTAALEKPVAVNKQQLKQLLEQNSAVIIDARMPDEFNTGRIPGAINIPFELLGEYIDKIEGLQKEQWVICYCDGPPCDKGANLADELFFMGFQRTAYYHAGLADWMTTEEVEQ